MFRNNFKHLIIIYISLLFCISSCQSLKSQSKDDKKSNTEVKQTIDPVRSCIIISVKTDYYADPFFVDFSFLPSRVFFRNYQGHWVEASPRDKIKPLNYLSTLTGIDNILNTFELAPGKYNKLRFEFNNPQSVRFEDEKGMIRDFQANLIEEGATAEFSVDITVDQINIYNLIVELDNRISIIRSNDGKILYNPYIRSVERKTHGQLFHIPSTRDTTILISNGPELRFSAGTLPPAIGNIFAYPSTKKVIDTTGNFILLKQFYFGPSGLNFSKPVQLSWKYSDADFAELKKLSLDKNFSEKSIFLLSYNEQKNIWEKISGEVLEDLNQVNGSINHFSYYGIGGEVVKREIVALKSDYPDVDFACSIPWPAKVVMPSLVYYSTLFKSTCVRHDYCYTFGASSYCKNRTICDLDQLSDMLTICKGADNYVRCVGHADLIYDAVDLLGASSYEGRPLKDGIQCVDYDNIGCSICDVNNKHQMLVHFNLPFHTNCPGKTLMVSVNIMDDEGKVTKLWVNPDVSSNSNQSNLLNGLSWTYDDGVFFEWDKYLGNGLYKIWTEITNDDGISYKSEEKKIWLPVFVGQNTLRKSPLKINFDDLYLMSDCRFYNEDQYTSLMESPEMRVVIDHPSDLINDDITISLDGIAPNTTTIGTTTPFVIKISSTGGTAIDLNTINIWVNSEYINVANGLSFTTACNLITSNYQFQLVSQNSSYVMIMICPVLPYKSGDLISLRVEANTIENPQQKALKIFRFTAKDSETDDRKKVHTYCIKDSREIGLMLPDPFRYKKIFKYSNTVLSFSISNDKTKGVAFVSKPGATSSYNEALIYFSTEGIALQDITPTIPDMGYSAKFIKMKRDAHCLSDDGNFFFIQIDKQLCVMDLKKKNTRQKWLFVYPLSNFKIDNIIRIHYMPDGTLAVLSQYAAGGSNLTNKISFLKGDTNNGYALQNEHLLQGHSVMDFAVTPDRAKCYYAGIVLGKGHFIEENLITKNISKFNDKGNVKLFSSLAYFRIGLNTSGNLFIHSARSDSPSHYGSVVSFRNYAVMESWGNTYMDTFPPEPDATPVLGANNELNGMVKVVIIPY